MKEIDTATHDWLQKQRDRKNSWLEVILCW